MTAKPRKAIPKVSAKRLAANGGKLPFLAGTKKTPIKKRNPERQAKAMKRSAKKHRLYMASGCRAIVDARADGMCEFRQPVQVFDQLSAVPVLIYQVRCTMTEGLQHHHRTYARYGGDELPEDVVVLCKPHHDFVESLKPAGNRFTRNR